MLVLFYSPSCKYCEMIRPVIQQVVEDHNIPYEFIDTGTPKGSEHARKYGILSYPTVLFVKDGKIVHVHRGYDESKTPEENIEKCWDMIKDFIGDQVVQ